MSDPASGAPLGVAVLGAAGRMGSLTVAAVAAEPDMTLVAALDRGDDIAAAQGAAVVVDFTTPDAVMANIERVLALDMNLVVGTSGFDDNRLEQVAALVAAHPDRGVIVVPNFAIGAVLLTQFAELAAPWFESVEIIELHHPDKVDAPSGTAQHTARRISDARTDKSSSPDATTSALPGARGASVNDVAVHSIRLRGLVAHQEVLLGNRGEVLTIRHDSLDRESFIPGVLLAIRATPQRRGLTVGLDQLLKSSAR